jgi:thiol-disulfide isomerase/thioredoxin
MLTVVGLISAIVYVYKKYVVLKLNPNYVANKEYENVGDHSTSASAGGSSIAYLTLFSTSWCPYCKSLKKDGVWDKFMEQNNGKTVNGYTLNIREFDCTNDSDPKVKSMLNSYKVDGFPSIKLLKKGDSPDKAIDFDAKPQLDALNQFVTTVL